VASRLPYSVVTVDCRSIVDWDSFHSVFFAAFAVTVLKEKYNSVTAVDVSLAIRLVYHLYQGAIGVVTIVPFGLIVTWWYARTGKLWPILVAHAAIDFTGLLQFVG